MPKIKIKLGKIVPPAQGGEIYFMNPPVFFMKQCDFLMNHAVAVSGTGRGAVCPVRPFFGLC